MVELVQNAAEIEPMGKFSPVPVDVFLSVITASEQKDTKSGTGSYCLTALSVLRLITFSTSLDNAASSTF